MKPNVSPIIELSLQDIILQSFLPNETFDPPITYDLFWQYYKPQYDVVPPESCPPGREFDREIMQYIIENHLTEDAISQTAGLFAPAFFAAKFMSDYILNSPEIKNVRKKYEQMKNQEHEEKNRMDESPQAEEGQTQTPSKADQYLRSYLNSPKGKAEMHIASSHAQKAANEASQTLNVLAGKDSNAVRQASLNIKDIKQISKRLNVRQFAEILGRFGKTMTERKREKLANFEVTRSRDLGKILLPELVRVATPSAIQVVKIAEFAQQGLLSVEQIQRRGRSVFVLVDGSGSMDDVRASLAKAFALALYEHGDFVRFNAAVFGSNKRQFKEFDLSRVKEKSDFLLFDFGGGTDFDSALTNTAQKVNKGTDVILITDGEDYISSRTVKIFAECGADLFVVFVDTVQNISTVANLNQLAKGQIRVSSSDLNQAVRDMTALVQNFL